MSTTGRAAVSRRGLLRGIGALGAAGTLAGTGCAAQTSDAVRVVVAGSAADKPVWQQLIRTFSRLHPDIKVEPVFLAGPTGSDFWTGFFSTVSTRIVGGQRYDLVYVPTEGQLLFASRNVMEPLDSYIARDRAEIDRFRADVDPRVLRQFDRHRPEDGRSYYLPFCDNTIALLFHKPTFARARVALPTEDWTWEDMHRAAHDIHRRLGVHTMAFLTDMWGFGPWLFTNGATVLDDAWSKVLVDSPAARESLRYARSYVSAGLAPAPGGAFDTISQMGAGKLAMMPGTRSTVQGMRQRKLHEPDFGFVPFPRNTRLGTSVGYGAMGMFKVSDKKDQAWEFLKYTLSLPFQRYQARTIFAGAAPVRRSAATGHDMHVDAPTGTDYLYEGLSYSTVVPGVANQARLADPFSKTVSQILAGTLSTADGLGQLQLQMAANLHSS